MKYGLTLKDFEPKAVAKREAEEKEEQKIMDYLAGFTSRMLMEGLRENLGHPKPRWGDGESWRSFFIKECERRGVRLLQDLGWPLDHEAEYRNLHTGDVERLIDVATAPWRAESDDPIGEEAWSIMEHWEPCDLGSVEKSRGDLHA